MINFKKNIYLLLHLYLMCNFLILLLFFFFYYYLFILLLLSINKFSINKFSINKYHRTVIKVKLENKN